MKLSTLTTLLFSIAFLVFACDSDDDNNDILDNNTPDTDGITYAKTTTAPTEIYNAIIETLNANDNIGIVAEVNHSENATNAGLTLDYTRTVYFGNPTLGTPIMQNNITAGLDLPQRISVYTSEDGETIVTYNTVDYIINRHDLGNVSTTDMIEDALANIVASATDATLIINDVDDDDPNGIVSVSSANDFETTYNNIITTLNGLEPITIMAELDHQANAASVDLELMPAKLIIFGNPVLGTPLMQESRTTALDLPQKMLVYQDENNEVKIIYNNPDYIADRHDIDNNNDTIETISQALENIAASGAAE
ncbi:DUF302 domain-containing protein [Formosa sediminum]|uniref:DUF302 domain-containing protein n=1 Tax=Formosa sediminum TaxID=2594004 RepID=A0A516GTS2_9FLAO|nr:DUF302 domain-containing protein [Formosa sediminum]QDO94913.1 DUF302 domain-containing protein [Formosa sediminum]